MRRSMEHKIRFIILGMRREQTKHAIIALRIYA
jgi:hypothetical protein